MCMQFECRKNRFLKTLEKLYIPNSPSLAILMYMLCLSLTVCVSIIVIWPLFCYGALVDDLEPWSVNAGSGALVSMFYLLSLPALPRRSVRRVCRGYAAWDWVECQQLPPTYRYIYIYIKAFAIQVRVYIYIYIYTHIYIYTYKWYTNGNPRKDSKVFYHYLTKDFTVLLFRGWQVDQPTQTNEPADELWFDELLLAPHARHQDHMNHMRSR